NIILLSDHGLRNVTKEIALEVFDPSFAAVKASIGNNVIFHESINMDKLKCNDPSIASERFYVYRTKEEVPLRYHYNTDRIGFPYISGNPGTMIFKTHEEVDNFVRKAEKGNHGWDNLDVRMEAIFFAIGPSIAKNVKIPPFQKIELYNFFADLLNVPAAPNDGTPGLLDELLLMPPTRKTIYDKYDNPPCNSVLQRETNYTMQSAISTVCVRNLLLQSNLDSAVWLRNSVRPISIGFETYGIHRENEIIEVIDNAKAYLTHKMMKYVQKPIRKVLPLSEHRIRFQFGLVYESNGHVSSFFVATFWCELNGVRIDWTNECESEKETRIEAYVLPISALQTPYFNCISDEDFLFDYRVSFSDIEKATQLSLLPKSMDPAVRRRI
ncbi:hypothetical protein PFISCL1PPCAC_1283, partial [Pristionchus fissidentatus]